MVVRSFLFLVFVCFSPTVGDAELPREYWRDWNFGAPCSTVTDRIEGTCVVAIKRKPDWNKK